MSTGVKALVLITLSSCLLACADIEPDTAQQGSDPAAVDETPAEASQALATAGAVRNLGGLDLDAQCRRQHGASAHAVLLQPVHSPGAAYAWRCRVGTQDFGIDMNLFCKWQYDEPTASSAFSDFDDGYSWYCQAPETALALGGLDLDAQCRREHGPSAHSVLTQAVHSPGAAYAWVCRVGSQDYGIDMNKFCTWQYADSTALSTFRDFDDGYSWYCYAPNATVLGGLDLDAQCKRQHGPRARSALLQPVHSPNAAYAWVCRVGKRDYGIDMNLFCRWQYDSAAHSVALDLNDAYSWNCYDPELN